MFGNSILYRLFTPSEKLISVGSQNRIGNGFIQKFACQHKNTEFFRLIKIGT